MFVVFARPAPAQEYVFGYSPTCNFTQATSCIVKAAGGSLMRFRVANWAAAAVVVYAMDCATVPTAGGATLPILTTCQLIDAWPLAAGTATAPTKLDVSHEPVALNFTNGLVLLCSSTGLSGGNLIFTAVSTCTFYSETH